MRAPTSAATFLVAFSTHVGGSGLGGMSLKASPKLAWDTLGCEDIGSGALVWRGFRES